LDIAAAFVRERDNGDESDDGKCAPCWHNSRRSCFRSASKCQQFYRTSPPPCIGATK
jgi:hypothetical protein